MRRPGVRPRTRARPRNTATAAPRPSLTVTSIAGAPARGTMRSDVTSPAKRTGGRTGSELAGTLERLGHTVAIVDKKKDAFRRLPKGFGGYRIVGFGFDRDTLEEAGVRDAGAFAAVTSGDNSNIMAARVARETFEV